MSAFVVLVAAGMAAGDKLPSASPEVVQTLDLVGVWEGTCSSPAGKAQASVSRSGVHLKGGGQQVSLRWVIQDEGRGRLRIRIMDKDFLGMYQRAGDQLVICFRNDKEGWPMSLRSGDDQAILTLRRVR
jgi:hypothetical protein